VTSLQWLIDKDLGARRLARLDLSSCELREFSFDQRLALLRRCPALCFLHPGEAGNGEFWLQEDGDFDRLSAELKSLKRRVWMPEWHFSDDDEDEADGEGDEAED
jgi:hypothetical protein